MEPGPTYSVIEMRQDGTEVVVASGLSHDDACVTRDLLCMSDKNLIDIRTEAEPDTSDKSV
jgi:hypothetical protein